MSDEILLRLSRADAEAIRRAMDGGLIAWDDASEAWMHVETPTMIAALDAALAADPAPEPEQFDQRMRAAMHAAGERTLREQFAALAEGPERDGDGGA